MVPVVSGGGNFDIEFAIMKNGSLSWIYWLDFITITEVIKYILNLSVSRSVSE